MPRRNSDGCLFWLFIAVILLLAVGLGLVGGALTVAIVGAMFLEIPFSDAWHAAWDNFVYLILFVFIIGPLLGLGGNRARRD